MTKIMIVGWYGTETIGDRAILAGLFHIFTQIIGEIDVRIGCLGTLLTERSVDEDIDFYNRCTNHKIHNIDLFDSRLRKEVDDSIKWADIIIIGGGPLMEIDAMYMLLYAFKKSKKLHKKSVVAGCGLGPFKTEALKKVAVEIVDNSDLSIFRDRKSLEIYKSCSDKNHNTYASIDPAAIATQCYLNMHESREGDEEYIAVNFREPPTSEYSGLEKINDNFFMSLLKNLKERSNLPIRLVPMHTFWIGDDDRYLLNRICRKANIADVIVDNKPLSLEETMQVFAKATCCIGMRFHSVLLQTFLNGKNIVLDYTDPEKGKIINLLRQLSLEEAYKNRYVSLVNNPNVPDVLCETLKKVVVDNNMIDGYRTIYMDNIKKLLV